MSTTSPQRPAPDSGAVTDAATPHPRDPTAPHHDHPTEKTYIGIALILATITAIEVAVYYIDALNGVLVPILLALSIVKFSMVVLWFMHLRFDSRIFRRLFVIGLGLALFVYTAVLTTFHIWTR